LILGCGETPTQHSTATTRPTIPSSSSYHLHLALLTRYTCRKTTSTNLSRLIRGELQRKCSHTQIAISSDVCYYPGRRIGTAQQLSAKNRWATCECRCPAVCLHCCICIDQGRNIGNGERAVMTEVNRCAGPESWSCCNSHLHGGIVNHFCSIEVLSFLS